MLTYISRLFAYQTGPLQAARTLFYIEIQFEIRERILYQLNTEFFGKKIDSFEKGPISIGDRIRKVRDKEIAGKWISDEVKWCIQVWYNTNK